MQRRPKQPTPQELTDSLLDFLERKFYQGRALNFAKDRPRLLKWVILWPASWLNKRGVTVPADRYRELFMAVFIDGLRFGNTGNITYLPAWLAKVIQSHFAHHGDEIYDQAKSMRNLVDQAVTIASRPVQQAPDTVRAMAQAASLLKPKRMLKKQPPKAQLNLL
jgi:hypothetical protein